MKNKVVIAMFGLIIIAAIMGIAQAQLHVSIEVKDSNGNVISGGTVPLGTTVYIHASYTDDYGSSATALLEVNFTGASSSYKSTIYGPASIASGTNINQPYKLNDLGTYEFKWTVTKAVSPTSSRDSTNAYCIQQRALARTTVNAFVVPEPATIAGLAMALSALGLFAVKRTRR